MRSRLTSEREISRDNLGDNVRQLERANLSVCPPPPCVSGVSENGDGVEMCGRMGARVGWYLFEWPLDDNGHMSINNAQTRDTRCFAFLEAVVCGLFYSRIK